MPTVKSETQRIKKFKKWAIKQLEGHTCKCETCKSARSILIGIGIYEASNAV